MFIIVIPVQVLVIIPTDSSVTALPAEHVRAPVSLIGRRSNFVEHFTRLSLWSNIVLWQF